LLRDFSRIDLRVVACKKLGSIRDDDTGENKMGKENKKEDKQDLQKVQPARPLNPFEEWMPSAAKPRVRA
jgi:hypothetical protein